MSVKQKVYLTFPKEQISQPVICRMYEKYHVLFNIRSASVSEQMGIMALELEADSEDKINQAIDFFKEQGVTVEPIEMDVITG